MKIFSILVKNYWKIEIELFPYGAISHENQCLSQVFFELLLLAFFNSLDIWGNWWFLWLILSEVRSLRKKLSWLTISNLLQRFFLLIKMLCFCFLYLNLTIIVSFFFKWWHVWKSLVSLNTLEMLFSRTSSPVDVGMGFISSNSWGWNCAVLTRFLSNWTIFSLSRQLQFLLTDSSEERISYVSKKLL